MQSFLKGLQGLRPQRGRAQRRRQRQRQRGLSLTLADRDRIRRTHLLICAGALSCLYLLTGCAALVWSSSNGGVGQILLDQVALRTAMHGLLVLAASGLYAASRNRVWLLAACTYLPATSAAAAAAAVSAGGGGGGGGGLVAAALLASQAAAGAALLAAWARLAVLTSAAFPDAFPDAVRPATPFGLRLPASWWQQGVDYAEAATAAEARRSRPLLDTVAYAAVALAYAWENVAAVSGGGGGGGDAAACLASGVALVAGAGHTSVKATLGLFFVVKDNPVLPEAGATYVLIVAGEVYASLLLAPGGDVVSFLLSRPADLLHAASVVLCACLLVQRWVQQQRQGGTPGVAAGGGLPDEEDDVELAEWVPETDEEVEVVVENDDAQPPPPPPPVASSPPLLQVCPRLLLLLHGCAVAHALAWFAECVAGVAGAGRGGCGRVYAAAVALGVGGAHGAVLYGVQSHNLAQLALAGAPRTRGHDRLRRRSFHTVSNLFYLAAAAAGFFAGVGGVGGSSSSSSSVRHAEGTAAAVGTTLSWVLLASAAVRVLAAATSLVVMGWVWGQASSAEGGGGGGGAPGDGVGGEGGRGGDGATGEDLLPGHVRSQLALVRRAGTGGVVGVVVCVAAVAAWGSRVGGGGGQEMHHSPGQALMFHFSFLYAVHALVSLHHNRAVSQRFLLAGSPFMLCIVAATVVAASATVEQQGRGGGEEALGGGACSGVIPPVLLGSLSVLISFVAGAILYVRCVRRRHPSTLVSGNVRWQAW